MSKQALKARLSQLERKTGQYCGGPAIRIIQDSELTADQHAQIAAAAARKCLAILRQIVSANKASDS